MRLTIIIILFTGLPGWAQVTFTDSARISEQLVCIEQQLMDDIATGDTSNWSTYLAANYFIVTEDGTRLNRQEFLRGFRPLPGGYHGQIKVTEPKLVFSGSMVVISYVADEYLELMGQQIHTRYGTICSYVHKGPLWQIIAAQVFEIPQLPAAITVPPKQLLQFTGTYYLNDTTSCLISMENGRLFLVKGNRPKEELLAETENVFMRKADTRGRKIFVKDERGTMLMRERRNGQDITWRRH